MESPLGFCHNRTLRLFPRRGLGWRLEHLQVFPKCGLYFPFLGLGWPGDPCEWRAGDWGQAPRPLFGHCFWKL